jgi:hypothetical protein
MTRTRYLASLVSAFLAVSVLSHSSFWLLSALIDGDPAARNRMLPVVGVGVLLLAVAAFVSTRPAAIAAILLAASAIFSGLSHFGREALRWRTVAVSLPAASVAAALVCCGFIVLIVVRARGGENKRT